MFIPNLTEIRKLAEDPDILDQVHIIAGHLADAVVEETPDHTGYAKASIRTRRLRTGSRVESTDPFWHLIEWGSVNNPPYQPMTRAAQALGTFVPAAP